MKKIAVILFISGLVSCASHDKQNKHYNTNIAPTDLQKDVKYVKKQLEKMHPDLYWYISKEDLDRKFDSLSRNLKVPMKPNEFYLKISPIVASVHQGHMSMNMISLVSPDSLKKKYKGSKHPLNFFTFEYLNDKLYVKSNDSKKDSIIQIGSEILDINGIKPQDLFNKYRKTFTSDGFNETGIPKFFAKKAKSFYNEEIGFTDSIQFHISCGDSVFHQTVKRTFRNKETKEERKQLADSLKMVYAKTDTLTSKKLTKEELKIKKIADKKLAKELNYKRKWFGYDSETKQYSKELIYPVKNDSTIVLLKIKDFVEGKVKVYDTIFAELKHHNVQNLIIDLRGNPGGRLNEIYKLSQYLNDSTYQFIQPATITNRTTFFNVFKERSVVEKILAAPFLSVFASVRGISAKRYEDNSLKLPIQSSKLTDPKPLNYKNKIYVITDGMTFSAAAIISSHLKGRNRAIFVGEETGGTFNGTVAGMMPVLKLPHSKLKLRVGLMTIKPKEQTKKEGFGVIPDVKIKPTIEEIVNKNDPELQWILKEIGKYNKP